MKIVFPMAGRGSRFQALSDKNPAYKNPKPLIPVKGKPMIAWAVRSFPPSTTKPSDLIFIILQEHERDYNLGENLQTLFGQGITIVRIPQVTRGAAETVLAAKKYINTPEDLIIADCDNYFDASNLCKAILHKTKDVAGIIPVIKPPDEEVKYSYALFDKNLTAIAVGEKDPKLAAKGAFANIGAYYFSHGSTFVKEAEEMVAENDAYGPEGKKEFYIAPLYQRLIQKGKKIKIAIIPKLWGLGTPKDFEYFIKNFKVKTI